MKIILQAVPQFQLELKPDELEFMRECASLHYDATCRATALKGGLLDPDRLWSAYDLKGNDYSDGVRRRAITFHELDLLAKVIESVVTQEALQPMRTKLRQMFYKAFGNVLKVTNREVVIQP